MLVLVLVLVHHIVDRVCAVRQRRGLLGLVEQRPLVVADSARETCRIKHARDAGVSNARGALAASVSSQRVEL